MVNVFGTQQQARGKPNARGGGRMRIGGGDVDRDPLPSSEICEISLVR